MLLTVEVELAKEHLIELPPYGVSGLPVELLGVVEEIESGTDQSSPGFQLRPFSGEFGLYASALLGDGFEAGANLGAYRVAALHEVEQVLLLGVEVVEGFSEVGVQHPGTTLLVTQRGFEDVPYPSEDVRRKLERGVVAQDGLLGILHADVGGGALVILPGGAHEVPVLAAAAIGPDQDEARFDAAVVTLAAPDGAFEVVVVPTLTFASLGNPAVEHGLHLGKQFRGDQRLVTPLELLAVVGDQAEVVAVAQHSGEVLRRDRTGRAVGLGAHPQTALCKDAGQAGHGVVPGGAEFEGKLDEGCPFFIDGDGADLVPLDALPDVAVADLGAGKGAAVLGLLAHLVADISAIGIGAVLVEGGEDAVHQLAGGRLINVLLRGYKCHFQGAHQHEDFGVIDAVTVESAQVVDDDVIGVVALFEPIQQLLKGWAALDGGGAAARFHVLPDDRDAHLLRLALAGQALGRD